MRRNAFLCALMAFLMILAVACENGRTSDGLVPEVRISISEGIEKDVIGPDTSLTIDGATGITDYNVTMYYEDDKEPAVETSGYVSASSSYVVRDILTGHYTVNIEGYIAKTDNSYVKIAEEDFTAYFSPSSPSASFVISQFSDTPVGDVRADIIYPKDFVRKDGSYSASYEWSVISGAGLDGTVVASSSSPTDITWIDSDTEKTAGIVITSGTLDPGIYTLQVTMTDKNTTGVERKTVSVIRLLPGFDAVGDVDCSITMDPISTGLTITDNLGKEFEIADAGTPLDINADSITVKASGLDGKTVVWYINGEKATATATSDGWEISELEYGTLIIEGLAWDGTESGVGYIAFTVENGGLELKPIEPIINLLGEIEYGVDIEGYLSDGLKQFEQNKAQGTAENLLVPYGDHEETEPTGFMFNADDMIEYGGNLKYSMGMNSLSGADEYLWAVSREFFFGIKKDISEGIKGHDIYFRLNDETTTNAENIKCTVLNAVNTITQETFYLLAENKDSLFSGIWKFNENETFDMFYMGIGPLVPEADGIPTELVQKFSKPVLVDVTANLEKFNDLGLTTYEGIEAYLDSMAYKDFATFSE